MAGLLDYIQNTLGVPKPDPKQVEEVRRRLEKLRGGGDTGFEFGLLGPTDEQLTALRQQQGIAPAEPPSPWVSIGRGATDLWEPVKQTYLNMTDQKQAQAYRQQRAEDERLYQRGMR